MKLGMGSACVILLSSACVANMTPIQNPEEFRERVAAGSAWAKMERRDFDRPFLAVFNDIKAHADGCFEGKTVIRTGPSSFGYGASTRSEARYTSSTMKLGDGVAQMTVQDDCAAYKPYKMPPGGRYVEIADIEAMGAGKTRVTVYGIAFHSHFASIFSWAQGQNTECPELK